MKNDERTGAVELDLINNPEHNKKKGQKEHERQIKRVRRLNTFQ